jgi:GAG-pre-integrase domain
MRFDTDSFRINIDNCCTSSITPNIGDFIGPIKKVSNKSAQGFNGDKSPVMHRGTVKWTINDDNRVARTIVLPNTYHVPDAPVRLMSPQHWAQQSKDNKPSPRGTWCATYEVEIVLQWNQRKYTKTVKLDPLKGNVATMWTPPGYTRYVDHQQIEEDIPVCFSTEVHVIDDEDDEFKDQPEEPIDMHKPADPNPIDNKAREHPITTNFDLNGPNTLSPNLVEPDDLDTDPSALMLRWHHRLSHIPMKRIQLMAKSGQLPKSLASCRVPMCQACQYGKASRRKWRDKPSSKSSKQLVTITKPGQCVSVDQL